MVMTEEKLTDGERRERFGLPVRGLRKLAVKLVREDEALTAEEKVLYEECRRIVCEGYRSFGLSEREVVALLIFREGKRSIFFGKTFYAN